MVLNAWEIGGDDLEEETGQTSRNKADLKPEFCRYQDEGCEYAKSCLKCPYPKCLYDEPGGRWRWLKELRNQEIRKLFKAGWQTEELETLFGVSERTIRRVMKSVRNRK